MLNQIGAPAVEPLELSGRPGPSVSVRGAGHSFGTLRALDRVDLMVPAGEVLGIVGPSGCGKSTLLEIVCGLREPTDGSVLVGEALEPERRLSRCAFMPQRDLLLPWLSAIDNAALAPSIAGATRERARARAARHFERLGLAGFEDARPEELSGGMRQRVAFLRTLMAGRPVLLLDEPFASLDAITRAEAQAWLAGVLAADVEEALYLSDRVVVMSPRPGRVTATLDVPAPRAQDRAAAVTSPEFAELRERALRLLAGGAA